MDAENLTINNLAPRQCPSGEASARRNKDTTHLSVSMW
jgi:hypothetical protein